MAELGLLAMLHPDELTADALRRALEHELQALADGLQPTRLARMRGLEQTTAALLNLAGLADDADDDTGAMPDWHSPAFGDFDRVAA